MLLKLSFFQIGKYHPPPKKKTPNKQQSRVDSNKKNQDRLYMYEENMDDGVKFQNQAGCFPRMMKAFAKQNTRIGNNN